MAKVDYHAIGVQFFRATVNSDDPVVTMQVLTFTGIREFQTVCSRYLHSFNYGIHAKLCNLRRLYIVSKCHLDTVTKIHKIPVR